MSVLDLDVHLRAIALGDADAFGRFVAGAERPLRLALRRFAAAVDVEAVLQESLLRLWQVAPRVESDGAPNALLRLALRIARNLALSEARRRRAIPLSALARDDESGARDLELGASPAAPPDPHLRRAIEACHDKLPSKPGLALDARLRAGGEADRELAERVGMTLNTFLQNVTRARRLLIECLRRLGVPSEELFA